MELTLRDLSNTFNPFSKEYIFAVKLPRVHDYIVSKEMRKWCTEQFGPGNWNNGSPKWTYQPDVAWFLFKNKKDAMLFYLAWHGNDVVIEDDD